MNLNKLGVVGVTCNVDGDTKPSFRPSPSLPDTFSAMCFRITDSQKNADWTR